MSRVSPELIDLMHRKLDGEELSSEDALRLRMGLAASSEAREMLDGFNHVQQRLRRMEADPFPDSALDRVLARTSRSAESRRGTVAPLRWAAVAAAVILLVVSFWLIRAPEPAPTVVAEEAMEAERALAELQTVFRLTSNAIDRSTEAAIGRVVREEVAPALRKIPVRFPASQPVEGGGS